MLDLSDHGLGEVETNKATVQHRRIGRSIPIMIWVGHGVPAGVTSKGNIRIDPKTCTLFAKKRDTWHGIAPGQKNASGAKHRHMHQWTARTAANSGNTGIDECTTGQTSEDKATTEQLEQPDKLPKQNKLKALR